MKLSDDIAASFDPAAAVAAASVEAPAGTPLPPAREPWRFDPEAAVSAASGVTPPNGLAGMNIRAAAGVDHDRVAVQRKSSMELEGFGLPLAPDVIDPKEAERDLKIARAERAISESPITSEFYTGPGNADIAMDDAPTLAKIEKAAKLGKWFGIGGARGVAEAIPSTAAAVAAPLETVAGWLPGKPVESELVSLARWASKALDKALPSPSEADGIVAQGFYSGGRSFGSFGVNLTAALMARSPQLLVPLAVAQTGGQTYIQDLEQGVSRERALVHAAADMVPEYIFEKWGINALLKIPAAKANFSDFTKAVGTFVGKEMVGEQLTTLWQDFNAYALVEPDKTFGDYLRERPDAAAVTAIATLVGAGAQAGTITAATKYVERMIQAEQARVEEAETQLRAAFELAGQTNLLNRDRGTLSAFFQRATEDATIFIDRDKLLQVVADSGVELEKALPSAAAQLADQASSNLGVELPVGELIAGLAGTKAEQAIIEHVRIDPNTPTLAELTSDAGKAGDIIAKTVEAIQARQNQSEEFTKDSETLYKDLVSRITTVSPFGQSANTGYAKLVQHWYETQAKRWGVTPTQIRDGWTAADGKEYEGIKLTFGAQSAVPQSTLEQNDGFLPEGSYSNDVIDDARLTDLRTKAAAIESPEKGVTLYVTNTGEAIATGPKGARIPQSFIKFAQENGLKFMARRQIPTGLTAQAPIAKYSDPMPIDYRASGALYFNEMGDAWLDRTGMTLFQQPTDFGQPDSYEFNEADHRPEVVAFAKAKWGEKIAANGKPVWMNFVRWSNGAPVRTEGFITGQPVVAAGFHGTAGDITEFRADLRGASTGAPSAGVAYFGVNSPVVASGYAALATPRTIARMTALATAGDSTVLSEDLRKFLKDAAADLALAPEVVSHGNVAPSGRIEDYVAEGANVMPLYYKMTNPLVVDYKSSSYRERKFYDVLQEAKAKGHDGVIFTNAEDSAHEDFAEIANIYAVFDAAQIKSSVSNVGTFDDSANVLRQDAAPGMEVTYAAENRTGIIVGARPGVMGWHYSNDKPAPPIAAPVQLAPNVENIGKAMNKILTAKPVAALISEMFGIRNVSVVPTMGSWQGVPEPSFSLFGEGMTFESVTELSKLLGMMFAQDSVVATQPFYQEDGAGGIPAIYIGSPKKLTKSQLDKVVAAATEIGVDYSTTVDGRGVKFLYFGPDSGVDAFSEQIEAIGKKAGLPMAGQFTVRSELNEASNYDTGAGGQVRSPWLQETAAGPSDLFRRAVDHLLIPYAKAVGGEGYRFSADRFAERFGLSDAQRAYIHDALRPTSGVPRSTGKIVTGEEILPVSKNDTRSKEPTSNNTDIMWALQNRAAEKGLILPTDRSPEAMKVIAEAIADEVITHVQREGGKSAIGWYDRALKEAKAIYSEVFPELADPNNEMLFDALLGAGSQGADVHANSVYAGRMFHLIIREGKTLPEAVKALKGTFGVQTNAIENNYLKLHQLLDRNGYDKMREIWNTTRTVGEWNAILRKDESLFIDGEPLKMSGKADQVVTGWMMFGPKIGSFINNLHGDYSTLTADLWFSRTWNRILGFSFLHTPIAEAEKYVAFQRALLSEVENGNADFTGPLTPREIFFDKKTGKARKIVEWDYGKDVAGMPQDELDAVIADPEKMLALAEDLYTKYKNSIDFDGVQQSGSFAVKSDLRRAAKNWVEFREGAVALPRNDSERAFQQATVEAAQKIIKRKIKETITVADMQAALWYHEKELFQMFGAGDAKAAPADYADAARNFMDRYRAGDLFYVEKPKPRYILKEKGYYLPSGGKLFQQSAAPEKAGSVTGPVVGIHFSKEKRSILSSSAYGRGMKGAEAERVMSAADTRLRQRVTFYVSTGQGVTPESDVGGQAHAAVLTNLYDADADALKLFRNSKGDDSAAETAVLDAGFDGYLTRSFGNQGAVVMLGTRSIEVEHVGGKAEANARATPAPAPELVAAKQLAKTVLGSRGLPFGQMKAAEWASAIQREVPEAASLIDFDKLDPDQYYYRDQIAGLLWQRATWYYSQLAAAIPSMAKAADKNGMITAEQAEKWLLARQKEGKFKQEELQWSGVLDYLGAVEGKVSVREIEQFVRENGVKVEEVTLGARDWDKEAMRVYGKPFNELSITETGELRRQLNSEGSTTKFSQYVLPGGENYRELLLTLPKRDGIKALSASSDGDVWDVRMADGTTISFPTRMADDKQDAYAYAENQRGTNFQSSHFDQPNILAHVRFNERTDAQGRRVLFLEEIQSDWGQKGKKEGFADESRVKQDTNGDWLVRSTDGSWINVGQHADPALLREGAKNIPAAPFITDTKSWTALALKRMVRYAVDNGFDAIAWTNGTQQAERYDLSKQVDAVTVMRMSDGYKVIAWKDGDEVVEQTAADDSELEGLIGKELAKKASELKMNDLKTYRDIDLKVGGEGMKGYYDQIVPQVAKKLGAQVGVFDLDILSEEPVFDPDTGKDIYQNQQQLGFEITDAMRAQAGMPLFQPLGEQTPQGSFDPDTLNMELLGKADYSTFLHEISHFFLVAQARMASWPDAPQEIRDDMQKILDHFGISSLEAWNAMTLDQQRAYHEHWAESAEQYFLEGKAPTVELQGLFNRFADWMLRVYRSVKEFFAKRPDAKLNPELSGVLDRMLATKEEIELTAIARGYITFFKDAAEGGMTPEQWALYSANSDEVKEDAEAMLRSRSLRDMKWLRNARNKFIKKLQEDARALRDATEAEVLEELQATDLYRAIRFLTKGETTDENGQDIKVETGYRLSIADVETIFPPGALGEVTDWRKKLGTGKNGMLAKEGIHPDVVAPIFGFPSGEAMLREIIAAPRLSEAVQTRTDVLMLERHGDLNSPEAVARAADAALHNDARTRMVATELAHLLRLTGSPQVLIKAAKEYARQLIDTRTSKTMKPHTFAAAESRAGREALKSLRGGNTDKAATDKRTELVNHVTARFAYEAEADIKKMITRLQKIAGYSDKHSSVTSRNHAMVSAVRAILAEYGIGRHEKKAAAYLNVVENLEPDVAQVLREAIAATTAESKDWRDVPYGQLKELFDAVDGLWSLAKRDQEVIVEGKRLQIETIQKELIGAMPAPTGPVLGKEHAPTPKQSRMIKFAQYVAKATRMENWIGAMDGDKKFGPWRRYIWKLINDATIAYQNDKLIHIKKMKELLEGISSDLKPVEIAAPEIGYTFGKGEVLGYSELLHALIHTGNESNKRKLLLGRDWATEREDGTIDTSKWDAFIKRMHDEGKITKKHWDFVQSVWDLLESIKPAAQKAHKEATGRYFAEIEATPIETPFGTYRGGYAPALADSRLSADADIREIMNAGQEAVISSFAAPRKGFTEKRAEGYATQLKLDLQALPQHIDQVLLFSHMSVPVRDVQRLLTRGKVKDALAQSHKEAISNLIMPWLKGASSQTVVTEGNKSYENMAIFRTLRTRAGMGIMFANVINAAQQAGTGPLLALGQVKPSYLIKAFAHGITKPRELAAHVASMSPYMKQRMESEIAAMSDQMKEILINPSIWEKAETWAQHHAYFMQTAVDNVIGPQVWLARFNMATDAGLSESEAIELADQAVRSSQGSNRAVDIAAMERGSPFYRMFMQFVGFFNSQINWMGEEIAKARLLPTGAKYRRLSMIALIGVLTPAMVGELIAQALRGGPDDEDKDGEYLDDWIRSLLMAPARYSLAMVPLFGQLGTGVMNAFNDKTYDDRLVASPAVAAIEASIRAGKGLSKMAFSEDEVKTGRVVRDVGTLISITTGIPVTPITKTAGYQIEVQADRIEPTSMWDVFRGTITGAASPASKP